MAATNAIISPPKQQERTGWKVSPRIPLASFNNQGQHRTRKSRGIVRVKTCDTLSPQQQKKLSKQRATRPTEAGKRRI